jgi:hypothetical protein
MHICGDFHLIIQSSLNISNSAVDEFVVFEIVLYCTVQSSWNVVSHVWVTKDGVRIGNWIY